MEDKKALLAWSLLQLVALAPILAYLWMAGQATLGVAQKAFAAGSILAYYGVTVAVAAMSLHQKVRRKEHGDNILFYAVPAGLVLLVWWRLTKSAEIGNGTNPLRFLFADAIAMTVLLLLVPALMILYWSLYKDAYALEMKQIFDAEDVQQQGVNKPPPPRVNFDGKDVRIGGKPK